MEENDLKKLRGAAKTTAIKEKEFRKRGERLQEENAESVGQNNIAADPQQITEQVNERDEIIDCPHNQLSLIEKQLMRYRELQGSS